MNTFETSSTVPSEQRQLALRLSLWAGIIGPLFFVLVFTIDGFLTPGYSAIRDVVSFLELGSTGWIQRLNFMLTGLLFILFAPGFFQGMRPKSASGWLAVTTVLLTLSGVGLMMAGLFPLMRLELLIFLCKESCIPSHLRWPFSLWAWPASWWAESSSEPLAGVFMACFRCSPVCSRSLLPSGTSTVPLFS